MKKVTVLTIMILILMFLLAACSIQKADTVIPTTVQNTSLPANKAIEDTENNHKIIVDSPVTLSNNNMFPINGKSQYLRLRMVEGKYYEDWNPGAFMGTIWEGNYSIELSDESGNIIAQTDLSKLYQESLLFKFPFDIQFDDYNNDKDLDFTIGQYGSSNGNEFKIFTLRKDGKVEELPIKEYPTLFISNSTGYYSTKLTKVNATTFSKQYYDNLKGKHFEDIFRWEGKEFIHVKNQELKENN